MNYGVVINMVSKDTLKKLDEKFFDFLNVLFAGIPENNRCPYNRTIFLGVFKDLEDEDDKLVSPDILKSKKGISIKEFVDNVVPSVYINPENVSALKVENFDEMTERMEKMAREIQEKSEKWKEERRQLENERMKEASKYEEMLKDLEK